MSILKDDMDRDEVLHCSSIAQALALLISGTASAIVANRVPHGDLTFAIETISGLVLELMERVHDTLPPESAKSGGAS